MTNEASAVAEENGTDTASRKKGIGLRKAIPISIGLMAAGLAVVLGMVYLLQDRLIYPRTTDMGVPAGWKAVDLGEQAKGIWVEPTPGSRTILFFHGNATNAAGIVQATKAYQQKGYGVLAPTYPGYAGAPGKPSQESITRLADLSMDWLKKQNVTANNIVVYGNSIGAGPAIHAAQRPHLALVVVSGVASLEQVAREHYGPLGGLVRDKWRNDEAITKVSGHKIVVHGASDDVVPISQGELLADQANVPLIIVPGGHEIAFDEGLQMAVEASISNRARQ